MKILVIFILLLSQLHGAYSDLPPVPVAYKGRIRPFEAYKRLWAAEFSQNESAPSGVSSLDEFILKLHFNGHAYYQDLPLFTIQNNEIKKNLQLNNKASHYSFYELRAAIYEREESNLNFLKPVLIDAFANSFKANNNTKKRFELSELSPGLWVEIIDQKIILLLSPASSPWNYLKKGMVVGELPKKGKKQSSGKLSLQLLLLLNQFSQIQKDPSSISLNEIFKDFKAKGYSSKEIDEVLNLKNSLLERISKGDSFLKMLPSKTGEWISLKALKANIYDPEQDHLIPAPNFTIYSDEIFNNIRIAYLKLEQAVEQQNEKEITERTQAVFQNLWEAYRSIAGLPHREAGEKMILYPSQNQLKAEAVYYQYPFIEMAIAGYSAAFLLLVFALYLKNWKLEIVGLTVLALAFGIHSLVLALRIYILERPPVSNMFETIIYVPWAALVMSGIFYFIFKEKILFLASSLIASIFLIILQATKLNSGLENVQAVLDSQYWLLIHVLLVVASYGAFALSSIFGHAYLVGGFFSCNAKLLSFFNKAILQTMYLGLAMLIPGTILGGVWAAESWGRFWDWDPKESWAFISACMYLIFVHAYRFHKIGPQGLALGGVIGFLSISFTWYGVNYILGTGLHSYGFGTGGEIIYYSFIICEVLFLMLLYKSQHSILHKYKIIRMYERKFANNE